MSFPQQIPPAALSDPAVLGLPALAPPAGVVPNFTNPESKGPIFVIVGTILLVLMVVFLSNRIYTKSFIVRKLSWDDLAVSLSALGAVALYVMCIWGIISPLLFLEKCPLTSNAQKSRLDLSENTSMIFILATYSLTTSSLSVKIKFKS